MLQAIMLSRTSAYSEGDEMQPRGGSIEMTAAGC